MILSLRQDIGSSLKSVNGYGGTNGDRGSARKPARGVSFADEALVVSPEGSSSHDSLPTQQEEDGENHLPNGVLLRSVTPAGLHSDAVRIEGTLRIEASRATVDLNGGGLGQRSSSIDHRYGVLLAWAVADQCDQQARTSSGHVGDPSSLSQTASICEAQMVLRHAFFLSCIVAS